MLNIDKVDNVYIFKKKKLSEFLINEKRFFVFKPQEIQKRLFSKGTHPKSISINGKTERVWIMPSKEIASEVNPLKESIDFRDLAEEEEQF